MGAAGTQLLLIAVVGLGLGRFVEETRYFLVHAGATTGFVDHILKNGGWRFLMMIAAVPALLAFFIRVFVPESPRGGQRDKGTTVTGPQRIDRYGRRRRWGRRHRRRVVARPAIPLAVRVLGSLFGFAIALIGYTFPVRRFLGRSDSGDLPAIHRARPRFAE